MTTPNDTTGTRSDDKAAPSAAAIAWANEGKGPLENYPDSVGFYTEREYERRGRTWAAIGYDAGAAAKAQESAATVEGLRNRHADLLEIVEEQAAEIERLRDALRISIAYMDKYGNAPKIVAAARAALPSTGQSRDHRALAGALF